MPPKKVIEALQLKNSLNADNSGGVILAHVRQFRDLTNGLDLFGRLGAGCKAMRLHRAH